MLTSICDDLYQAYKCIIQEYEEGTSPDAVVVKDLEKFDKIFQAFEYKQGRYVVAAYTYSGTSE